MGHFKDECAYGPWPSPIPANVSLMDISKDFDNYFLHT